MNLETISLAEFCRCYGNAQSLHTMLDGVAAVDALRNREKVLNRFLPLWMVRRMDAGFARSNTVHPDTGRALYTICRALRAGCVFETGTYWGYSTAYLAAALPDDAKSRVWTFDIYAGAGRHVPRSLRSRIEFVCGKPSTETLPAILEKVTPDLFFQDSRHDYAGVGRGTESGCAAPANGRGRADARFRGSASSKRRPGCFTGFCFVRAGRRGPATVRSGSENQLIVAYDLSQTLMIAYLLILLGCFIKFIASFKQMLSKTPVRKVLQ